MEEETKLESLLLSEKDVKLENEDSWGEIKDSNGKKELLDHDYCMRNPVKVEEVDDSKSLKLEESDDFGYPSLEPKPERIYEYPEHFKLNHLLDHDYCMQNSVKMEEIHYSLEDLSGSELEELDSLEYSKYLKLEPIETDHDIGPPRKQNSYSKWKPRNRKCAICHKIVRPDHFISTESKDRQTILMLGLVLSKKKSVEEAQLLITGKHLYTCIAHLKEAIDEIFNVLNIKSMDELKQCFNDKFQKLMEINKNLCPDISFTQFYRALIGFVVKFTESIQRPITLEKIDNFSNSLEPKMEEPDDFEYSECPKLDPMKTDNNIGSFRKQSASSMQKQCYHKCSVCREEVCLDELHCITTKGRKLILMLGLILKGTKTIGEAQLLISDWIFTCNAHLNEAIDEIFKALNIKSLDEFLMCDNKNMQISIEKLVDILRMMCPGFSVSQFRKALTTTVRMFISEYSTIEAPIQKRWCMVCHQLENVRGLFNIFSKNNKTVLLVGLIVVGKKTMKEARLLMTYPSFFCCEIHLTEAGHNILEVLNIKSIDEWYLCSKDKLAEVMRIVRKLCSECSAAQFKIHLTNFLLMVPTTIGN